MLSQYWYDWFYFVRHQRNKHEVCINLRSEAESEQAYKQWDWTSGRKYTHIYMTSNNSNNGDDAKSNGLNSNKTQSSRIIAEQYGSKRGIIEWVTVVAVFFSFFSFGDSITVIIFLLLVETIVQSALHFYFTFSFLARCLYLSSQISCRFFLLWIEFFDYCTRRFCTSITSSRFNFTYSHTYMHLYI